MRKKPQLQDAVRKSRMIFVTKFAQNLIHVIIIETAMQLLLQQKKFRDIYEKEKSVREWPTERKGYEGELMTFIKLKFDVYSQTNNQIEAVISF